MADDDAVLEGPVARQIAVVLRLHVDDEITLCDGQGTEAPGILTSVSLRRVTVRLLRRAMTNVEAALDIHLFPALLRAPRFELVLQKATELGVAAITPMLCHRSVARPSGDDIPERWRSIVREAVEQSGRSRLPALAAAVPYTTACARAARADLAICCSEHGGEDLRSFFVPPVPRTFAVLVGPEGGLEPAEVSEADHQGLRPVTLGTRILRAETAAIAVCSAALCLAGDWR